MSNIITLNSKKEYDNVFHISDIHIRNTKRHEEYKSVFNRLYEKMNKLKNDKTIIVVTGDIVHTKTELSPESIDIAIDMFTNLSEIAPVVIIMGNHDRNMTNIDRLDAITPIVKKVSSNNIYYLKETGFYQLGNILFGIKNIVEKGFVNFSDIENEWNSVKLKNKYSIALYHGHVSTDIHDVGFRMNEDHLVIDNFNGFDYVMLGDIHKHYYLNDSKTIAYAGSLIQQSHGETLDGHGMIHWKLSENKSRFHEIKNDYGFCDIRIIDGEMINDTKMPKYPTIRFMIKNTTDPVINEIIEKINETNKIVSYVKDYSMENKLEKISGGSVRNLSKPSARDSQNAIIREYLQSKEYKPKKINKILELHNEIYEHVLENDSEADSRMNGVDIGAKWDILELEFSNCLSYGENNKIDFRKYPDRSIIGLFAPNHTGKSAVLDIILFCLFDKFTRGDRRDFMNKNKKFMECSILFQIGSTQYYIKRTGKRESNGVGVRVDVIFKEITFDEDGKMKKKDLTDTDKTRTNNKIIELIGYYEDYLTTSFCLQNSSAINFTEITQKKKKEYLNQILKLNIFDDCFKEIKNRIKNLVSEMKSIESKMNPSIYEKKKKAMIEVISEIKHQEKSIMSIKNFLNRIIDINQEKGLVIIDELKTYNIRNVNDIILIIKNLKTELELDNSGNLNNIIQNLKEDEEKLLILQKEYDEYKIQYNINDSIEDLYSKKMRLLPFDGGLNKSENIIIELEKNKKKLADKTAELSRCNTNKIDVDPINIKMDIKELRNKIKNIDIINHDIEKISCRLDDINNILFDSMKHRFIDENTKLLCSHTMKIYKTFMDKLRTVNGDTNDIIEYYSNELKKINNIISFSTMNIDELLKEKNELESMIMQFNMKDIINNNNEFYKKKINYLEKCLDDLKEVEINNKKYELLSKETHLINETINNLEKELEKSLINEKNKIINEELNKEIRQLENYVDEINESMRKKKKQIEILEHKILKGKQQMMMFESQIKKKEKIKKDLFLLQKQRLMMMDWEVHNIEKRQHNTFIDELKNEITEKEIRIEQLRGEMEIYKKDIQEYKKNRDDYNNLSEKLKLYQLYSSLTNENGLPYEILKMYLPIIENDVNTVLSEICDFTVKFIFFTEETSTNNKTLNGAVDINICRPGSKSYKILCGSGFEKFIIGLAVRMSFGRLSLISMPNFLIVDEGWSCLDTDNLNNIEKILSYVKNQYKFLMIISHIDAMKESVDHIINIERKDDGYSYIR